MDNLLFEIAEKNQRGLQLITMHTGAGKTHAMKEMILKYTLEHEKDENYRNIIVVTSQKKNLPKKDLEELFVKKGYGELFVKSYLYLDSIHNNVIESYRESFEELIIKTMGKNRVVTNYIQCINDIRAIMHSDPSHVDKLKKGFARDEEREFRKRLKRELKKHGKDYDERFKFITTHEEWSWVPVLYPSVYTKYRRIFVMSADKFVLQNDTIIGSANTIYDSSLTENAIIFIDEFDATKGQILKRMIERSLNRRIYFVDLFNNILNGLAHADKFPAGFFVKADNSKIEKDLRTIAKENLEEFESVSREYRLDINKKMRSDYSEEDGNFIFQSYNTFLISDAHKIVGFSFDTEENIDIMSFDESNDKELLPMFGAMRHCINMFCGLVKLLAINYQASKADPSFSFEDSINSVLDQFRITNFDEKNYLLEDVLAKSQNDKKKGSLDSSVYERGYRYFIFDDSRGSDLRTRIVMVSQDVTPEKILVNICKRGLVIGMSATAGIRSPISNYDLSYVESCLDGGLLPSVDNDPRIQKKVQSARANYPDEMIDVKLVPDEAIKHYSSECWNKVYKNRDLALYAYDLVGKDEFNAMRYLKVAFVFKDFMSNDGHAFLCFNNKLPVEKDEDYDYRVLKKLFLAIIDELRSDGVNIEFDTEENIVLLSGDDFDRNKKSIIERLSSGKKMFVMTTYNTFSAGQNIQYPHNGHICINVSDRDDDFEMDFDSVYCELPRFVVPRPESWDDMKDILELIFYFNFLYEVGDFSKKQCDNGVRSTLMLNKELDRYRNEALATVSANRAIVSRVIQAVGRLSRTNMKHHIVRIYLDIDLKDHFIESIDSYGVLSKESEAIIKVLGTP